MSCHADPMTIAVECRGRIGIGSKFRLTINSQEMIFTVHAGTHVRSAATIGGNIVLTQQKGLQSDFCTIMLAAGAQVSVQGKQQR